MFLTATILYTKLEVGKFSTLAIFFRVLFGFTFTRFKRVFPIKFDPWSAPFL
jgi:hypothetical protein